MRRQLLDDNDNMLETIGDYLSILDVKPALVYEPTPVE